MRGYVVMGVSGCGKSTIAAKLAERMGLPWLDGDALHGEANVAKMSRGEPLTDEDRWPWLDRVGAAFGPETRIVACSALKRAYRERIAAASPLATTTFVLLDGSPEVLQERVRSRPGHFMPAALLDSQLETLERPSPDEDAVRVDIDRTPEEIVDEILRLLRERLDEDQGGAVSG